MLTGKKVVGWGVASGDEACKFCPAGVATCYVVDMSLDDDMEPACNECAKGCPDEILKALDKLNTN
jgi:hypothetical protein